MTRGGSTKQAHDYGQRADENNGAHDNGAHIMITL